MSIRCLLAGYIVSLKSFCTFFGKDCRCDHLESSRLCPLYEFRDAVVLCMQVQDAVNTILHDRSEAQRLSVELKEEREKADAANELHRSRLAQAESDCKVRFQL